MSVCQALQTNHNKCQEIQRKSLPKICLPMQKYNHKSKEQKQWMAKTSIDGQTAWSRTIMLWQLDLTQKCQQSRLQGFSQEAPAWGNQSPVHGVWREIKVCNQENQSLVRFWQEIVVFSQIRWNPSPGNPAWSCIVEATWASPSWHLLRLAARFPLDGGPNHPKSPSDLKKASWLGNLTNPTHVPTFHSIFIGH